MYTCIDNYVYMQDNYVYMYTCGTKNLVVSVCALKKCFSSSNVSGRSIYIHSLFVINLFFSFGMILLIIITIESWRSVCSMLLKMKLQWISKQFPFLEGPLAVCPGIDRPTVCLVRFSIVTPKGCPYYSAKIFERIFFPNFKLDSW